MHKYHNLLEEDEGTHYDIEMTKAPFSCVTEDNPGHTYVKTLSDFDGSNLELESKTRAIPVPRLIFLSMNVRRSTRETSKVKEKKLKVTKLVSVLNHLHNGEALGAQANVIFASWRH